MPTKIVVCPGCNTRITCEGDPGENIEVKCPNCGKKGLVRFEKTQQVGSEYMIEVRNFTKIYDGVKVVDNISFNVRKGEIFGFLGPNGAGKSTTIKAMLGLIYPSSGEIKVNGFDITREGKHIRKHIGYLPENITFYDNLTALQTLYFYSDMRSIPRDNCWSLLEEFELREFANKKVGTFSKGMARRLGLVQAFLGKPKLVILDEPTVGLDPSGLIKVREKIKSLKKSGTTVFLSSHILSEVQKVCDRVGIMNKGLLVAVDAVANLTKETSLEEVFMKYTRR